mgnify:CR=1 FL=1
MVTRQLGWQISGHPTTAIAATIVITLLAVGCIQIFGIEQEFTEESFLPDMEVVKASNEISENYTATYTVPILAKSKNGDVLTSESLVDILQVEKIITADAKIVPALATPEMPSSNVNSIADTIAQMLLTQQNITTSTFEQKIFALQNLNDSQIKQFVMEVLTSSQTPLEIKGLFSMLLTKDFNITEGKIRAKGTIVMVSLNGSLLTGGITAGQGTTEDDIPKIEERMDALVKNIELRSTEISVMGNQIVSDEIQDASIKSMGILLPIAFGLVLVILVIIYRNGLDLLFSLLALVFAIIWVYGFGSAMGFSFNPMTIAVPVLIVGLGIDYGIHITMRYREEIRNGKKIKEAVDITIKSVGMVLLLATITTVVAFSSNLISPIGLLGEFGVLCAIGIISSFITMTAFVPACKQLQDTRKLKKGRALTGKVEDSKSGKGIKGLRKIGETFLDKAMSSGAVATEHHPIPVIVIVIIITLGAVGGALQMETTFNFEDFLPEDLEIAQDLEYMLNEFEIIGGMTEEVEILIKSDITSPKLLTDIDESISNMVDDEYVIRYGDKPEVRSILSLMDDWATNSATYGFYDPNFDATFQTIYNDIMSPVGVPKSSASKQDIRQLYEWLYTNPKSSRDTRSVLHKTDNEVYDGTVLRVSVNAFADDNEAIETLRYGLREDIIPLEDSTDKTVLTGGIIVTKVVMDSLNDSQINSLIITLIVSFIILTLVFLVERRSFALGIITLMPLIFCVIWTLGTMYIIRIPLNIMTITVASLTIGLGITYGIHITHRFLEDLKRYDTVNEACRSTVSHTGTALFGAASTTIAGFGLLVFSIMPPLQQFGAITALAILYSFLASVFILPTFLVIWAKHGKKFKDSSRVRKERKKSHQIPCPQCNHRIEVHEKAKKFKCPHCGFKADFC